jgi:hypothetical protein
MTAPLPTAPATDRNVIRVTGLHKRYTRGKVHAVRGIRDLAQRTEELNVLGDAERIVEIQA